MALRCLISFCQWKVFFSIGEELRQKFGRDVHFHPSETAEEAKFDTWEKKKDYFCTDIMAV